MTAVRAIYENGVFRPVDPVDLPERSEVVLEARVVDPAAAPGPATARVYEVLSRRFDAGARDLAERHDEHQA